MWISAPAWAREHPGPWLPAGEAPGTLSGTQPVFLRYTSGLEAASHVAWLLALCLLHALLLLLLLLSHFSHVWLCDSIDSSPPGSPVPGILQARTVEWVAISFSSAWKWKWSRSIVSDSSRPHGLQPTRLLHPWDFPVKSTGVGCHRLLRSACTTRPQISKWC